MYILNKNGKYNAPNKRESSNTKRVSLFVPPCTYIYVFSLYLFARLFLFVISRQIDSDILNKFVLIFGGSGRCSRIGRLDVGSDHDPGTIGVFLRRCCMWNSNRPMRLLFARWQHCNINGFCDKLDLAVVSPFGRGSRRIAVNYV